MENRYKRRGNCISNSILALSINLLKTGPCPTLDRKSFGPSATRHGNTGSLPRHRERERAGVEVAIGIGTPVPGLTVGDAQASPAQAVGHPIHPHPYRMGQVFLLLAHERGHRHDGFEPQRFDALRGKVDPLPLMPQRIGQRQIDFRLAPVELPGFELRGLSMDRKGGRNRQKT